MKKVVIALIALVSFSITTNAQAVSAPVKKAETKMKDVPLAAKPATTAKVVPLPKSQITPTAPAKAVPANNVVKAKAPPVVLKKDGTPDKRFNNNSKAMEGPVKKDGTPDMRFKNNKKN